MWQLDLLSWSVFYAFVVVSWVALCLSFVAFLFCGMQCVCHLVCLFLGFVFGCCFSCILADETRTGFLLLLSGLQQTACDPLLGLVGLGGWAEAAGHAGKGGRRVFVSNWHRFLRPPKRLLAFAVFGIVFLLLSVVLGFI